MATRYPGDKDKQPTQADFDKAWENTQKGKTMPNENDMGPLPTPEPKNPKKGVEEGLKKGLGGKALGMKKGGSVSSASKRADGCATKGKTKGRMI